MAKVVKPRIHSLAKEINVPNKELIDLLKKYGMGEKNHMSTLSPQDMDIILDYYTQKYDDGSDISEFFKRKEEPKEEKKAEPKPADDSKKAPTEQTIKPKKPAARYVDTRPTVVDLEKIDKTEKIEELVVIDIKDDVVRKQKIKKSHRPQSKSHQEVDNIPLKAKEKKKEKVKVLVPDEITVGEFANRAKVSPTEVIKRLIQIGVMASVSQSIDFDTASLVGEDMGLIIEKEIIVTDEDRLTIEEPDDEASLEPRPPVVVVMGHVDHGKTSLLDAIRKANVTATEAGGITQHIGAYRVTINGKNITFLDTPGHEAFTSMRARGAQVTDVAIIVVAADDGIMPQTVEAINHARAAEVSIIIAINKIDKESANPDRVMQELTEHGLVPEEWGGDTICVPVSAKTGVGLDNLLEMVILVSEMKELRANPNKLARGTVIEAKLDRGRGPVATVLVQNGTLKSGDAIIAGTSFGRIRAMIDDQGNRVDSAGPSVPVEITGLDEVCEGGDLFYAVADEKMAKNVVNQRKQKLREKQYSSSGVVSLDDLFEQIKEGEIKELRIIVKADVQGSVEAVTQSLEKLSNEEVRVKVIHGGVGGVNESDVMLAAASNAIIVGFNVRPDSGARSSAEQHKVDMRLYRVIYEAIEEIEAAMKGMLAPEYKEKIMGHAEIRAIFKASGVGSIAGCYVQDGKILRNSKIRIVRNGVVVHEGELNSLKRFKDDVREVNSGYECGMSFAGFNDIKEGDIVECSIMEEIAR